jgi:hypothetical protein
MRPHKQQASWLFKFWIFYLTVKRFRQDSDFKPDTHFIGRIVIIGRQPGVSIAEDFDGHCSVSTFGFLFQKQLPALALAVLGLYSKIFLTMKHRLL